jgi:DNA-binding SARP family transcriptional activator
VHRTRALLGGTKAIERTADGYRLIASTDVDGLGDDAVEHPERVLAATGAEPFPGFDGEHFDASRRRAAALLADAQRSALVAAAERGEDSLVLQHVVPARASEPYDEQLVEIHLTALARCGRTAEAVAEFEAFRRLLAADLGVDPGPSLQELHLRLLSGAEPAPPAEAAAVVRRRVEHARRLVEEARAVSAELDAWRTADPDPHQLAALTRQLERSETLLAWVLRGDPSD